MENRTYFSISCDLIMFSRNRGRFFMGMQITPCWTMFKPDQVTVAHKFNRIGTIPKRRRFVEFLDEPPIITIFMRISRDLLLLSSNSSGVEMHVWMQISTTSNAVFQGQQRSISHFCIFNERKNGSFNYFPITEIKNATDNVPRGVLALCRKFPSRCVWKAELKYPSPGPLRYKTCRWM